MSKALTISGRGCLKVSVLAALAVALAVGSGCEREQAKGPAAPGTQPATQPAGGASAQPSGGAPGSGAPAGSGSGTDASASADPAAAGAGTRPAVPQPGKPGETFVVEPNAALPGRLGRLVVKFPEGSKPSDTAIRIFKAGEESAQKSEYGQMETELLAGTYDVEVQYARIPGVEIKPRHDSRLRVGALKVTAGSSTAIKVYRVGQEKPVFSGYGTKDIGLPVGAYRVEISGQSEEVTIKDGQVTEF